MGKSTINIYKWPFSIAMLNYQRVSQFQSPHGDFKAAKLGSILG